MERLLLALLVLLAGLLPRRERPHRHRRPQRYRGRRRGSAAQVLLQDHQWTAYLREMIAWRHAEGMIRI